MGTENQKQGQCSDHSLNAQQLIRVRQLKIEPPTLERLERITRSAIRTFEERFFANTLLQIPPATREQIDRLLNTAASSQELTDTLGNDTFLPPEVSSFSELKTDPGRIGVDSFQKEVAKLQQIRQIELPDSLFKLFSIKVLQIYKQRVTVEPPRDLRRHPDPIR